MYSCAPRWSEAWSPRSVPACCSLPPPLAIAVAVSSRLAAKTAARDSKFLVMHRHPFRHRLGPVELGPDRHGDEESEIEEGQHAADDGLGGIGAGTGTDLAQPQEADREHQQHRPTEHAAVAVGLH